MQVLGISGSPVKNSNIDRLVKTVLEATALDYELIKLSEYDIHPCRACLGCAGDNICKQQELTSSVSSAEPGAFHVFHAGMEIPAR